MSLEADRRSLDLTRRRDSMELPMPNNRQHYDRFVNNVGAGFGSAMGGVAAAWIAGQPAREERRERLRERRRQELARAAVDPVFRVQLAARDRRDRLNFLVLAVVVLLVVVGCHIFVQIAEERGIEASEADHVERMKSYPACLRWNEGLGTKVAEYVCKRDSGVGPGERVPTTHTAPTRRQAVTTGPHTAPSL